MVSVEKLECLLNIRCYGQLSEFGYCLHNEAKDDTLLNHSFQLF
jgi:hypothetical protein